jgi:hypothetical protein
MYTNNSALSSDKKPRSSSKTSNRKVDDNKMENGIGNSAGVVENIKHIEQQMYGYRPSSPTIRQMLVKTKTQPISGNSHSRTRVTKNRTQPISSPNNSSFVKHGFTKSNIQLPSAYTALSASYQPPPLTNWYETKTSCPSPRRGRE